ncbi:Glycosylphosphatidylinositol (GPI) anchor assembly protein [Agyrium rufum]|nr:Glycosylphosphatidylinositol (GPI) anchor assembly protein [Agyrium rufum]
MEAVSAKSRDIKTETHVISIERTSLSQTFSHGHLAILGAYGYLRFSTLVAEPIPTLTQDLLVVGALQLTYAITCLPAYKASDGSQSSTAKSGKASVRRKVSSAQQTYIQNVAPAILSLFLTLVVGPPILMITLILFGAPLTTHFVQTSLLAAHISLLAGFPLVYVHGISSSIWREIIGAMLPIDEVWGATIGCFLGSWLGAIPIPLDWDREWQKWPVTIVTGAYMGYIVGKLAGRYLLIGKRIEFD